MASKPDFGQDAVRKVAELARLELTAEELQKFSTQIADVLGYIQKLQALDTSKVEPLTTPLEMPTPLREDEVHPGPGAEAILACAPESLYESFKVPQVMGSSS